jgi:lipid A disaccharide synthetase
MRFRHWRKIKEYKELMTLPNVELIHPSVSSKEMLENCKIVITINGTTGLEAALYEKPAIVFTDTIYQSLPSVHRLKSLEELPEAISESLKKEVNISDINEFINILERNSFNFDIDGHYNKILEKFHRGGFMISNEMDMNELNSFIEENRETYEMLAIKHLDKIKNYKKII